MVDTSGPGVNNLICTQIGEKGKGPAIQIKFFPIFHRRPISNAIRLIAMVVEYDFLRVSLRKPLLRLTQHPPSPYKGKPFNNKMKEPSKTKMTSHNSWYPSRLISHLYIFFYLKRTTRHRNKKNRVLIVIFFFLRIKKSNKSGFFQGGAGRPPLFPSRWW